MRKETPTVNAGGGACTAYLLAHAATLLETHGTVKIVNVGKSPDGPGSSAYHLGQFMQDAIRAKQEGKF